jgi:hypothetical protein
VLLLAAYLIYTRRAGASGAADTSGTPGPDRTGSAAQQPNGGASSVPGSLPPLLVDQPDPLTSQVQTTDGSGSGEAPSTIAPSSVDPGGPMMPAANTPGAPGTTLYKVATGQLGGVESGGTILVGQDAKGSTPAQRAAAQAAATRAAENYAKNFTAAHQGYYTAGL